jgi:hypothetical protein
MAGSIWSNAEAFAAISTVRGEVAVRGTILCRVLEVVVSLTASAAMAIMVAIGGSAVQRTTATPQAAGAGPRFDVDPNTTPAGKRTVPAPTYEPDPMTWCRPLNGSTICIREKS